MNEGGLPKSKKEGIMTNLELDVGFLDGTLSPAALWRVEEKMRALPEYAKALLLTRGNSQNVLENEIITRKSEDFEDDEDDPRLHEYSDEESAEDDEAVAYMLGELSSEDLWKVELKMRSSPKYARDLLLSRAEAQHLQGREGQRRLELLADKLHLITLLLVTNPDLARRLSKERLTELDNEIKLDPELIKEIIWDMDRGPSTRTKEEWERKEDLSRRLVSLALKLFN